MARDFDVRNALDGERDAAFGVGIGNGNVDDHVREVDSIDIFDQWNAEATSTLDCAVSNLFSGSDPFLSPREDQDFVGASDVYKLLCHQHDGE